MALAVPRGRTDIKAAIETAVAQHTRGDQAEFSRISAYRW